MTSHVSRIILLLAGGKNSYNNKTVIIVNTMNWWKEKLPFLIGAGDNRY